jgi:putative tricarboxylic transport membrane protein
MICYVSGRSLAKGLLAATLGILFALIGTDPLGGTPRLTFGLLELQGGLNVIALVTGLFGITEVLIQIEKFGQNAYTKNAPQMVYLGTIRENLKAVSKYLRTIVRSSLIGTFIGVLPGIGSETSPWVAYGLAKRSSKDPDSFGKGTLEGVVAPEAANNAVCGAAMIPMLVFGIPGDIVTAILMSALIAQGLQPGPFLLVEHRDVIYALFMSVLIATFALYIFGRLTLKWWMRILTIPAPLLYSIIVTFCVVGTYSYKSSSFDLVVMFIFGIIGYIFRKLDIAIAPLLLSFVLAKILEESLRRGLIMVDGNILAFFERPIAAIILGLTVVVLISFVLIEWRKWRKRRS